MKNIVKLLVGFMLVVLMMVGQHKPAMANQSYSQYVKSLNPAGYWRLNVPSSTTGNSVPNLSSTSAINGLIETWSLSAATYGTDYTVGTPGPIVGDTSLAYTQLSSSVEVALGSFPATATTWSVAFWEKTTTSSQQGCFFTWGAISLCQLNGSSAAGNTFTYVGDISGPSYANLGTTVPTDGNWHFVVLNVTSLSADLWVDGSKTASGVTLGVSTLGGTGGNYTEIGNRGDTNEPFKGSLSDVAYFTAPLTQTQIQNMYAYAFNGTPSNYSSSVMALSPYSYWRMGAYSGTNEPDLGSNAKNLTYTGTYTLNQPGMLNSDVNSKSVLWNNGYASASASTLLGYTQAWGVVFWYQTTTGTQFACMVTINGVCISVANSTVNGTGTLLTETLIGTNGFSSGLNIVADGKPHQAAFIYNGAGTATLYQDGVAGGSFSYNLSQNGTGGLLVGAYGSDIFAGNIGDVAYIPNLTPAQVTQLYNAGKNIQQIGNFSQAYENYLLSPTHLGSNIVAYYRLDETSGTSVRDYGPLAQTGTMTGSGYTFGVPGAFQYDPDTAMSFNGSGAVTLPVLPYSYTSYSVAFWLNNSTASQNGAMFDWNGIGFGQGNGGGGAGSVFQTESAAYYNLGTTVPSDGNWHFVVANFYPSYVDLYLDGSFTSTTAMSTGIYSIYNAGISYDAAGGLYFTGSIDDIAFINRNLTPTEVSALYHLGTMGVKQKGGIQPPTSTLVDNYNTTTQSGATSVTTGTANFGTGGGYATEATSSFGNMAFWVHLPSLSSNAIELLPRFIAANAGDPAICIKNTSIYWNSSGNVCGGGGTGTPATFSAVSAGYLYVTMVGSTGVATLYADQNGAPGAAIATTTGTQGGWAGAGNPFAVYGSNNALLGGNYSSGATGFGAPSIFWNYGTNTPPVMPPAYPYPIQQTYDTMTNAANYTQVAGCGGTITEANQYITIGGTACLGYGLTYQNTGFAVRIELSSGTTNIFPKLTAGLAYVYGYVTTAGLCFGGCSAAPPVSPTGYYDMYIATFVTSTSSTYGIYGQLCPELSVGVPNYNACVTMAGPQTGSNNAAPGSGAAYFVLQDASGTTTVGGAYPYVTMKDYGSSYAVPLTLSKFLRGY
jgi:hypothetical protein